jgi:glutamyl-Q tRNA(Asp) synthetase
MSDDSGRRYRGRFAPSPTGPLHFGSLVAAVGSFLDARAHGGEWLVRMEDLDPPREVAGAAQDILRTLGAFGLHPDRDPVYQSQRGGLYQEALQQLESTGNTYPCACSRRDIERLSDNSDGRVYPGTCRNGLPPGRRARSIRLRVPEDASIRFDDRLQGEIAQYLPEACGDFVLRRADGLFAYQLAVVVDDAEQGITDVVRGADLLECTARQVLLYRLLGYTSPRYLHLPVAANRKGEKLSKQTGAPAIDTRQPVITLCRVLEFLDQRPPPGLREASLEEFWNWAIASWDVGRLPPQRLIAQR